MLSEYTQHKLNENQLQQHPWRKTIKDKNLPYIKYVHNSTNNSVYPPQKSKNKDNLIQITVIGDRWSKEFIYCSNLMTGMHKYRSKIFDVPIIRGVSSAEWPIVWRKLKVQFGGISFCLQSRVAILYNGMFFGGDTELKDFIETNYSYHLRLDYCKEAIKEFSTFVRSSGRPFAYFHISIDNIPVGAMIFMLYSDVVPNTCENFLQLCKTNRNGYSGSPIHRIVKDGWIQCGGYNLKSTDLGCENFAVPFDRRGVLAMCNDGRHMDCSTQFFVLLQPAEWMRNKYVAFGQLVEGKKTLEEIEKVPTWYESPTLTILMDKAGILNLDCKHQPINRTTISFLNKHIEDLVTAGELFFETVMARVWAMVTAKERKMKEQGKDDDSDHSKSSVKKKRSGSSSDSRDLSEDSDKENQSFDVEVYTPEDFSLVSKKTSKKSSVIKSIKPYYLPLTDLLYPNEIDEDFDLKKFLKGVYCLECDLQEDLPKDEKQKEKIRLQYASFPSDILFVHDDGDDEDALAEENKDLDSEEEEEIKNYIRNNVDRVSFAGGIIRGIGKGNAMFNLFEGARKSEMINLGDDDLKKLRRMSMYDRRQSVRKSEMITLNDEELRRLRRTSMMERRTSTVDRGGGARKSVLPNLNDENLQKLRRISMMDRTGAPANDRRQSVYDRRQSFFDPSSKKSVDVEVPGLNEDQIKKLRRISMFDQNKHDDDDSRSTLLDKKVSISAPRQERASSRIMRRPTGFIHSEDSSYVPVKLPVIIENDDEDKSNTDFSKPSTMSMDEMKKRRQTAFAEDLTRVKSFQKEKYSSSSEDDEDDESSGDDSGKIKIKLPPWANKAPKKIRRRPTGFVRPEDLKKYGISDEDAKVSIQIPDGANDTPHRIKRRQTGFVRKSQVMKLLPPDETNVTIDVPPGTGTSKDIKRRQTGFVRPCDLKKILEEEGQEGDEEVEEEEEEEEYEEQEEVKKEADSVEEETNTRRVTGFAKGEDLEKIKIVERKSSSSSESSVSSLDKHVQIDPSTIITRTTSHLRRPTGFVKPDQVPDEEDNALRASVLTRLYEDAKLVDDTAPPPTLKDYVPISERIPHNLLLTFAKKIRDEAGVTQHSKEREYLRPSINLEGNSIEEIVNAQYGNRVSSKISSEYVRRIYELESANAASLRSIEYAKSRPCMTISAYRKKNKDRLKRIREEEKAKIGSKRESQLSLPPIIK